MKPYNFATRMRIMTCMLRGVGILVIIFLFVLGMLIAIETSLVSLLFAQPNAYSISMGYTGDGDNWYERAEIVTSWFKKMGYNINETSVNFTHEEIKSIIQHDDTASLFVIAHGSYRVFEAEDGDIWYYNISDWMKNYSKIPFTFLHGCDSMCEQGNNTLSYQFRKGSNKNTAVVGGCGLGDSRGELCWDVSREWLGSFFNYTSQGMTIKESLDRANADYPVCVNIFRFEGDGSLKLVPPLKRRKIVSIH
ncbi:MAG: hypothetical protein ACE5K4_10690 [Candidatus Hydrothermarchaeota archaeon]